MTGVLFVVAAVAGVATVCAAFALRTETPDNQRRVIVGGAKAPKAARQPRILRWLPFREPEPDPCEDSTVIKVAWLAKRLGQD